MPRQLTSKLIWINQFIQFIASYFCEINNDSFISDIKYHSWWMTTWLAVALLDGKETHWPRPFSVGARGLRHESRRRSDLSHRVPVGTGSDRDRYPAWQTYKKRWKIAMLSMGKSTISMAIFNSYGTNHQRLLQVLIQRRVAVQSAKIGWEAVNMSLSHIVSPPTRTDSRIAQLMVKIPKNFGLFSPSNYPAW